MQCTLLPGPWPAIVSSAWPSARDWQQATMVGPGPWQPVTRLRETRSLWYRVDLPPATQLDPAARHVALTIPSFYASAEVYLDDELVAASDLPYLPLRVDVSRLLATPSAHELLIRIGACFAGDEELDETLHGKQDWYTPAVGNFGPLVLTQSRLPLPEPHWATTLPSATEGLLLAPELSTFDGQISGWLEAPDGSIEPVQLLGDRGGLHIHQPQRWSLDTPHLYTVRLVFEQGSARGCQLAVWPARHPGARRTDSAEWRAALPARRPRSGLLARIECHGAQWRRFACRNRDGQAPGPESAPLPHQAARSALSRCGRCAGHAHLGGDSQLRKAHRTLEGSHPPGAQSAGGLGRVHPSAAILTIINEDWGPNIGGDEAARCWLREEYQHTKALAGNRLIVDNSPCPGADGSMPLDNFHIQTDLDDFHCYFLIPDAAAAWHRWVADFADRPAYTFSPTAEAVRTGQEPLVISEFGQWGLPNERAFLSAAGDEPEWFRTHNSHLQGLASAAGVRARYARLGLDRVFGSYEEMTLATQRHQAAGLAHAISEVRLHPGIRGYVITEWTDVEWEANELLDMGRRLKPGMAGIADVLKDDLLVLRPSKTVYTPGERLRVEVATAWVRNKRASAMVRWRSSWVTHGALSPRDELAGLTRWEPAEMTLPAHELPEPWVDFLWLDEHATMVDYQRLRVPVVQPVSPRGRPRARLFGAAGALESVVMPTAADETHAPLIATGFSAAVMDALRENRRVLVLAGDGDSADIPPDYAYLRPLPRAGTHYEGNWITAWHYIDPRWLRAENPLGIMFEGMLPMSVIPWHERMQPVDVLSGLFVGWVDLPAVTTYQHGTLTVTTFPLLRGVQAENPLATRLLYKLLDHAEAVAI